MNEKKTIYLDCCCQNEVLRVEYDSYFNVALFSQTPSSLWERLRNAWHMVRHGEPFGDQFVMNWHDANRLSLFLIEHSEGTLGMTIETLDPNNYEIGQHRLICEELGVSHLANEGGPTAIEAVCELKNPPV